MSGGQQMMMNIGGTPRVTPPASFSINCGTNGTTSGYAKGVYGSIASGSPFMGECEVDNVVQAGPATGQLLVTFVTRPPTNRQVRLTVDGVPYTLNYSSSNTWGSPGNGAANTLPTSGVRGIVVEIL